MKTVYTEEHAAGTFHAEDHGADVAGVFFKPKRCRKPRYIATARVSDLASIKRRIAWYIDFKNLNAAVAPKADPETEFWKNNPERA